MWLVEPMELRDSSIFHGREEQMERIEASLRSPVSPCSSGSRALGKPPSSRLGSPSVHRRGGHGSGLPVGVDPSPRGHSSFRRAYSEAISENPTRSPMT